MILNEVRGAASKLNGIVTVGGQKADVIIANPNGITVNGGGFKNVGRGILTTGTPQIGKDGALTGFDVRQGTLTVGAAGWNDKDGADYTEVLARAVALQGKLQGKNLAVSTGPQKVDYASGEISAGTAAGAKPTIALDTAALGGMYADSITLIANEKGVGVKNAGTLEAAKRLIVTSSGCIENSSRIATTADSTEASPTYLSIETTEKGAAGTFISNGGRIEGKGLLVIETGEDISLRNGAVVQNNGSHPATTVLNAGRNLVIESKTNVNNAKGSANLSAGGRTMINDAAIQAGSSVYSSTKGDTELGGNTRIIAENVTVLSNGSIGSAAVIEAKDTAHIEAAKPFSQEDGSAPSDVNIGGGSLSAAKSVAVLADGNLKTDTARIRSAENLYLHAGKNLDLNIGGELPAGMKNVSLKAGETAALTAAGDKTLAAVQNIDIEAGNISTDRVGLKAAGGKLSLTARKNGVNLGVNSRLSSGRDIEITALQGNIVSDGLKAEALGHVSILAAGNVEYQDNASAGVLNGKGGVYTGSVGTGRLKTGNTNISANTGDIRLQSGAELELGNGKQHNTFSGNHISVVSGKGSVAINNIHLNAKASLNIDADRALTVTGSRLDSGHNMQLNAANELITLNRVDAYSRRHMNLTAYGRHSGKIWQNNKQSTQNTLIAEGVLSLGSHYSQVLDNTTLRAGALNIKPGTDLVKRGKINWSTVTTKVMQEKDLQPLAGRLNIDAGGTGTVTIEPGNRIVSEGDLTFKNNGLLRMTAKAGNRGSPSAQVSELSAKGNIDLIMAETDFDAARISAGKNLRVLTTKGKLDIDAVKNTLKDYIPVKKVEELRRDMAGLDGKIAAARKTNPRDRRIEEWEKEKDKLEFYLQAINKTITTTETHRPHGYEYRQSVLSGQNIDLVSAQGIWIRSSDILAEKRLTLQAAGVLPKAAGQTPAAIRVEGMNDSYEIGYPHFKSHYDKALINKPSRLQGKQGMIMQAAAEHPDANIVLDASQLNAQRGGIDLKAYGSILLESGDNNVYTFRRTKSKHGNFIRKTKFNYNTNHMIMPAPVELNAGGNINLQAGKDIDAYTTRFYTPQGRTTLIAGEELNLLAEQGIHEHKLKTQKNSRFIGIKIKNKNYSRKELTETRLPVKVIAQGANTLSGWNTVLEGTDFSTGLQGAVIQAGVGDKARADAKIILKGIKTTVSTEEKSNSKSAVWQSMAGKGSTVETLQLPKFEGPAAPVLSAPGGYIVDIPKGNLKTEIEKLAKQPEYAYLKQLQVAKNVNWNQVQLAYDKWDYKQEGLTGAGAAIIALAVTVVTSGAGTGAALGLNGTAAAATDAAFASLAGQASVSLINNKGDVGKTLKELGRSSTVKNLVVAAATAGVADKIGASALNNVSDKQWVNNLTVNLANAGSAALINTAVNGGSLKDNLEANILAALVNTAHGEAASKIKQLDQHYIAHKIAHAVAGCAAAAANKGKCQDGAIGAAVGEIVGEALTNGKNPATLTAKEREQVIAYSKLIAGTAAAVAGGDEDAAAKAAEVAVKNNQLSDKEGREFDNEMTACSKQNNPQLCRKNTVKKYQNVADKRLAASIAICTDISRSTECRTIRKQHLIDSRSLHSSWAVGLIGKDDEWYKLFSKSYTQADLALQSYHLNTAAKSWLQSGNTKPLSEWMADQGYTLISGVNPRFIPIPRGFVKQNTPITNVKYPEGISFDTNLKRHLANADGFSQKQGIKGAHNRTNFMAELNSRGGRVKSETQTDIEGITRIKYEIPTLDRTGKPDGGFKEISSIKTVYDPKKFSDDKILQMAQKAASQGYSKASKIAQNERTKSISERKNVIQFSETFDGIKFRSYFDVNTGRITNIHPE